MHKTWLGRSRSALPPALVPRRGSRWVFLDVESHGHKSILHFNDELHTGLLTDAPTLKGHSRHAPDGDKTPGEKMVRKAVAGAYPLLAALRKDIPLVDGCPPPPIWARLMYLESEAIFQTMLGLKELNIPSLPVHDSLIVTTDHEQTARETLSRLYSDITGAVPLIP
jgi:hypothetical protein